MQRLRGDNFENDTNNNIDSTTTTTTTAPIIAFSANSNIISTSINNSKTTFGR